MGDPVTASIAAVGEAAATVGEFAAEAAGAASEMAGFGGEAAGAAGEVAAGGAEAAGESGLMAYADDTMALAEAADAAEAADTGMAVGTRVSEAAGGGSGGEVPAADMAEAPKSSIGAKRMLSRMWKNFKGDLTSNIPGSTGETGDNWDAAGDVGYKAGKMLLARGMSGGDTAASAPDMSQSSVPVHAAQVQSADAEDELKKLRNMIGG